MIYLFDRAKKLQKIIPRKHIINATQTKVRNGIYQLAVEVPIFYETKQGTQYNYQKSVGKAEFAGHYDDKNRFQLYKIYSRNITANEQGEFLIFDGVHIFFDEAKAMGNLHDRRFRDSEAKAPADVAFNSIGWTIIDYDVTDRHDINFYRASVTDAWNDLISTYGVEFDYELQFDGRKIISKNIIMKKQIGKWTGQRFAYGTNVLTLTQEQDESEVYTAAVGRGRGEESGDGFGPRLEFGDIAWSKDGITKPVGQNYIELPSATAEYGFIENGVVKPRIAPEIVFEDIEDKKKLADATYYWLLENCLPKATWKTEVARIGNLKLGDTVGVLYKAAGIIKRARVEKIEYNLLDPELSKLTLGDFHHFENRQMKRINAQIKRVGRDSNDRITRIKNEWNAWIDNQFTAAMNQFEQNLIDQQAQIEADRLNMTNLIDTKTKEFDESLAAGMEEAERKRQENYDAMSEHVDTTVDTTRTDLENSISTEITRAKDYAEQQAQAKAEEVRTDLETVTSGHQQMLDSLQDNVMNIDDFLGDKTVGLNELLYNERMLFEEKLNNVDTWHYNMLRGTRFDEGYWEGRFMEKVEADINYFEFVPSRNTTMTPYIQTTQEIQFNKGETYMLSFDFQTYAVRPINYIWIISNEEDVTNLNIHHEGYHDETNITNTYWNKDFRRYFIKFTPNKDINGFLRMGINFNLLDSYEVHGRRGFQIRLPYLTTTENTRWLYHQLDSSQNVEEITRRITQLEDGREEFITKSQFDFETGEIEGSIKNIIETVDESTLIIQNHENWILTNGASIERTVDGFDSKAWLSDIHNPNIIPYSDVHNLDSRRMWEKWNAPTTGSVYAEYARFRNMNSLSQIGAISPELEIVEGETYTLSWTAFIYDNSLNDFDYCYVMTPDGNNAIPGTPTKKVISTPTGSYGGNTVYKYTQTFVAPTGHEKAQIMIGARVKTPGSDASFAFKEPKLELGDRATPYHNAFSNITQRADNIMLAVQGIGERGFLNQSDVTVRPDYVQIGSQRLDGSNIGALLRVSPTGIDAVAEAMRLSGDLYVDGDITALAVQAVEGNFARLFANQLTANVIKSTHISADSVTSAKIRVDDVLVNRIVSNTVYANDVIAKVGNFIDLNAGNIVTAGLSANVITADHIQVGTALIDKFFATSARIDQLITKTHFVNEMHALTLDVVDLNASQIRTRLLSANTIEAEWLKGGTALLDKIFATTGMFERMMAKSGFVTTLNTLTIDTDQITIRRYDGVPVIDRGSLNFNLNVPLEDFWSEYINWTGQWYEHSGAGWQTYKTGSFRHEGRKLVAHMLVRLSGFSPSASEWMYVRIRPYGQNTIGMPTVERRILVRNGVSEAFDLEVNLGRPTFARGYFYIEFRKESLSNGGAHADNIVQTRTNRVWQEG